MSHLQQREAVKQELVEKYDIKTDRDLIQQLNISVEDSFKLFAWIKYQSLFSYEEGYNSGKDELIYDLRDLLTPTRKY